MRSFLVVGNPENRRVTSFVNAATTLGATASVVSWLDVITDAEQLLAFEDRPLTVRLESWGENPEVERALLRRGLRHAAELGAAERLELDAIEAATAERGRIVAPRQQHLGVLAVLKDLERVLEGRPAWSCAQPIAAIRTCFDKRATHALCEKIGVRVPRTLPSASRTEELLSDMARAHVQRAYVKLTCGSSASCLALVEHGARGTCVTTSMAVQGQRLFNSLRVRRYAQPALIERVLGFLLAEGALVEHAVEKTSSAGRHADVRLLCVRGTAPFEVVRESQVPITNLHLGGRRGDVEAYRRKVGEEAWREAHEFAQRLARTLGTWHLGVDVAFERGSGRPFVLEGNAFGDLLPGIERDARSVYGWEIEAITAQA